MAQIVLQDVDDTVIAALERKAELHERSLEQELRDILEKAAGPAREERIALAARIRAMTPAGIGQTDSAELVREDRGSWFGRS